MSAVFTQSPWWLRCDSPPRCSPAGRRRPGASWRPRSHAMEKKGHWTKPAPPLTSSVALGGALSHPVPQFPLLKTSLDCSTSVFFFPLSSSSQPIASAWIHILILFFWTTAGASRLALVISLCPSVHQPQATHVSSPKPPPHALTPSVAPHLYRGEFKARSIKHRSGLMAWSFCASIFSPLGFPYSSVGKESTCRAGDLGSIPGSGRSPGEGNGNPLQYPCLENLMDAGAW